MTDCVVMWNFSEEMIAIVCFAFPVWGSGLQVIKIISCSTQLSMKFFLLVGILTLMRRKNSILGLSEPGKC